MPEVSYPVCVSAHAVLYVPRQDRYCYGALHALDSALVFLAEMDGHNPEWRDGLPPIELPRLTLKGEPCIERRGVFVIQRIAANLNDVAQEALRPVWHPMAV